MLGFLNFMEFRGGFSDNTYALMLIREEIIKQWQIESQLI